MRPRDYLYLAAEHRGLVVFGAFVGVLCAAVALGPFELVIILPALALAGIVIASLVSFVGRRGRDGARVVGRQSETKKHALKNGADQLGSGEG